MSVTILILLSIFFIILMSWPKCPESISYYYRKIKFLLKNRPKFKIHQIVEDKYSNDNKTLIILDRKIYPMSDDFFWIYKMNESLIHELNNYWVFEDYLKKSKYVEREKDLDILLDNKD